jgi:hypothetical protein
MTIRSARGRLAAIVAALLSSGCVVFPTHVYVADAGAGTPVYERCSLTPELPIGVKVERAHLQAIVSIVHQQANLVRVQFDIPEGTIVSLRESSIRIDVKDGTVPRLAPIANVNPVAPARYPETPVIQKLVMPVDAPMRGGRLQMGSASSDKHYWIAAPFEGLTADDVWITLPELSVDGVPTKLDEIHFVRRRAIGLGRFNC